MTTRTMAATAVDAFRGDLPVRYHGYPDSFHAPFAAAARRASSPGQRVLDVGSGRSATVPPGARPSGTWYVGNDISAGELALAPEGSYDDTVAADIRRFEPTLESAFDLVVSFQVLEHVRPLAPALDNLRRYLRPGGRLVAQLSGTFGAYSLIARVTPRRVTEWAQLRLYGREPETVFRPRYDRCWASALDRAMDLWDEATVTPLWIAEPYFHFSPVLRSAYVTYEEWARRSGHRNLAPYYLLEAVR